MNILPRAHFYHCIHIIFCTTWKEIPECQLSTNAGATRKLRCAGTATAVGAQVPLSAPGCQSARTRTAVLALRAADLALQSAEAELACSTLVDKASRAMTAHLDAAAGRAADEAGVGGVRGVGGVGGATHGVEALMDARAQRASERGRGTGTLAAAASAELMSPRAVPPPSVTAPQLMQSPAALLGGGGIPGAWSGTAKGAGAGAMLPGTTSLAPLGGGWWQRTTHRSVGERTDSVFILKDGAEGGGDLTLRSKTLMEQEIARRQT